MNQQQKILLPSGVDTDSDQTRIKDNKSPFIKGLTMRSNANDDSVHKEGENTGVLTPIRGSEIVTALPDFPSGINYCVGTYESKATNELYVFVRNSLLTHFIYKINGWDGSIQIVYKGSCLNFQLDPQYFIAEGRCTLHIMTFDDRNNRLDKPKKFLVFTDGYNDIRFISVEDSIATDSFNKTTYPFFAKGNGCDDCMLINLGVSTPNNCIEIEPVDREDTDSEKNKKNLLTGKGIQFRIKFIDVFFRESEHGIISDRYFTIIGGNCIDTNNGLARCVRLKFDAGCPLVNKIQIEYRTCSGNNDGSSIDSDWLLYETIDKYNDCEGKEWYQRDIRSPYDDSTNKYGLKYNSGDHTFEYIFCADKECRPIPISETSRTQNPLPIKSSGLTSVGNEILLSNNLRGLPPLDCSLLDKISMQAIPPAGQDCDDNDLIELVVYAVIINYHHNQACSLWAPSEQSNVIQFGVSNCQTNLGFNYDQYVPGERKGFVGYLAGTPYYAISEQVQKSATGVDVVAIPPAPFGQNLSAGNLDKVYRQRFTFKVPRGKYSFRIANHKDSNLDGNYQRTSTYVKHTVSFPALNSILSKDKEMIINLCSGVTNNRLEITDKALVICDLSAWDNNTQTPCNGYATVVDGYLYEEENKNIPIELVPLTGASGVHSEHTDHNGFYFQSQKGDRSSVAFSLDACASTITLGDSYVGNGSFHIKHGYLYAHKSNEYPAAGRREHTGRIVLCDQPNVGVAGVLIVMKFGQYAFTDSQGYFKLLAHQRYSGTYSGAADTLIISQAGACVINDCSDACVSCFSDISVPYLPCGGNRNTDTGTKEVGIRGVNIYGLESGGHYGYCITAYDKFGRHTFAQATDKYYLDIPSLRETKVFKFCTINFAIDSNAVFPDWVHGITFGITRNLNNDDSIMWIVDKVLLVDNTGRENTANPTKIRLYYESLNEYNSQNNFATNTNWQFLSNTGSGEQSVVIGDYVEFIKNGDNSWFTKAINSLVLYDKAGMYFDIEYNQDLANLQEGALIKLIRPKQCIDKYLYYELCPYIKMDTDHRATVLSGTLNAFDSYMIARSIPVPQYSTNANGDVERKVELSQTNYLFEHHSPSDFYGNHCANGGRINVKNEYERQQWFKTEMARSKTLNVNGSFNGLSYFSPEDVVTLDGQDIGAILVALPELTNLLVICEKDCFVVGYSDNTVVLDGSRVVIGSEPGKIGRPQRKIGSNYGCEMRDINTIRKRNGLVIFLDSSRNALVANNYGESVDLSLTGYKSYLSRKINRLKDFNKNISKNADYYFVAGIDPKYDEYYLTVFGRSISNPTSVFINDEGEHHALLNETICIDIYTGIYKCDVPFTPEYYGSHEGYIVDKGFHIIKHGAVNNMRSAIGTPYMNFFQTQCKKYISIIVNENSEKSKRWLYLEVYCKEHLFVANKITTSEGQVSRIKSSWFDFRDKFSCAPFLCDLNTPNDINSPVIQQNKILEGNTLTGKWVRIDLESLDADDAKYCEISSFGVYYIEGNKTIK